MPSLPAPAPLLGNSLPPDDGQCSPSPLDGQKHSVGIDGQSRSNKQVYM